MWNRFRSWAERLFGRALPPEEQARVWARRYEEAREDPVTRIVSEKLASLTFADSALQVDGTSPRSRLLRDALDRFWREEARRATAQMLGKGGVALLPRLDGAKGVRIDWVDASRVVILGRSGSEIRHAAVLLDEAREGDRRLYLAAEYEVLPQGQVIRYTALDESGRPVPLSQIPAWAGLQAPLTLQGAGGPLFACIRCPRDDRRDGEGVGVPITHGAEGLIAELTEHARICRREYRLTRPMLGLDAALWRDPTRPGERLDIRRLRRTVQDDEDPFVPLDTATLDGRGIWQYYAPGIRYEAMDARWQMLSRRIERACGLSQGILTERQVISYQNRDEVRAAQYDTFAMVRAIRDRWEAALTETVQALDRLCERAGLGGAGALGQTRLRFDWDMSLIESSSETFAQMAELQKMGAMTAAELRAWQTGEAVEEAAKKCEAAAMTGQSKG